MNVGRLIRIGVVGVLLPLVILLVAVQLWMYRATGVVGLEQRPATGLQDIQSVTDLQTYFDRDIGKPRLVVLISPT